MLVNIGINQYFNFTCYNSKPFAMNPARMGLNEWSEFFGTRRMAVDFLHFKNHVGTWCKVMVIYFVLSFVICNNLDQLQSL